MCGIGGYWSADDAAHDPELLSVLDQTLTHRGPDKGGRFRESAVGLVIRRLRVIDLETGDQPVSNEDGSVVTVFNGEIYNHQELRQGLEKRGHQFRTRSDTEVIVHLYEEYGDEMLHHLRGMFAIALWDRRRHRLLLARDRLGIKPLYYFRRAKGLIFASEINPLLSVGVDSSLNEDALAAYFRLGYIPAPATAYSHINSLPPGWKLTADSRGISCCRWWSLPAEPEQRADSLPEAAAILESLVEESVRLRLLSDVPLGAFLSGGMDSTLVVGMMARLMDRPVETFTIGFEDKRFDESGQGLMVAAFHGTNSHHQVIGAEALDVLDDILTGVGQPFADPSAVPTLLVSRLARRHVTVALSGDGGDELFGGYTRYVQARSQQFYDRIPGSVRRAAWRLWPQRARGSGLLRIAARNFGERYVESASLTTPQERRAWLVPGWVDKAEADPFHLGEPLVQSLRGGLTGVEDLLRLDLHSYLPDVILTKVDRMSMSCSLEARVPLLDHKVVEFVCSLPLEWRMGRMGTKRLMRKAFARYYPPAILERGKTGFGIPVGDWLRGPLRNRIKLLEKGEAVKHGPLRAAGIRHLVQEHLSGSRDRGRKLWALLVFEGWWRRKAGKVSVSRSGLQS